MSTKKALISIKRHLGEKNSESALHEATELLKSTGPASPEAAQTLIYRGLALSQLQRFNEAEKSYLQAYTLDPGNPLASLGLKRLYLQKEDWEKLASHLELQVQTAYDGGNGKVAGEALKELLELRVTHGPVKKLYSSLVLLLASSPLTGLLQSEIPPNDTYVPLACPRYPPVSDSLPSLPSPLPHPVHLAGSLPIALIRLIWLEAEINKKINIMVENGRKRLNSGPEKEVRRRVDFEVLGGEGLEMVELLHEIGSHPLADEDLRREVEVREFNFWKRVVASYGGSDREVVVNKTCILQAPPSKMPLFQPKTYTALTKEYALGQINSLAEGFVLLGICTKGSEEGWLWVLEGQNEATSFYDIDLLHKYIKAFPKSYMTAFLELYCQWYNYPLPESQVDSSALDSSATAESKMKQGKKIKGGQKAWESRRAKRAALSDAYVGEDIESEGREQLLASMTKLVDKLPRSVFVHRVMSRIFLEDQDFLNAISFAEDARELLSDLEAERGITLANVKADLDTILGVALVPYYPPKHHVRATRLLEKVLADHPSKNEARFACAQISQFQCHWAKAREHFERIVESAQDDNEKINAKEEVGWCLVNEKKLDQGRDILEEIVQLRDSQSVQEKEAEGKARGRAWFRLGKTEWMIGDEESKKHAEEWFMASIRADPTYAASYTSLGICYSSATPSDDGRALKCFQRAFELDATEVEAARRLAVGYADSDEWALVKVIAIRVMEGEGGLEGVTGGETLIAKGRFAPQNGWAWKALGSAEVHYKGYSKAAQAFQIALRADDQDVSTWILLGESYVKCGRHVAGLKTFSHALNLDPDNWRALYGIGQIQSELGAFDQAIVAYQQVMEITNSEEIGVVGALAEANLNLGRQTAAGGFRERSRQAFHRAISLATEVLKAGRVHRAWAWKLIGDATFELSSQESSMEEAQDSFGVIQPVLEYLLEDDDDRRSAAPGVGHAANVLQDVVTTTTTLRTSIFAFAYRAHLLKNEPRVADPALYDYASALYALANRINDEGDRWQCLKTAISAIRTALDRDPGDERLWNALGVICAAAGPQLAQHAFVVSLELYSKDPVVWVNLGYLYLQMDDLDLANQCFLKAQITDPDYARAWLGQGLLAERHGDQDHAKALFSHSVTLSAQSLLEADLALAATTFSRFFSPDNAIDPGLFHQPAFALKHYCHQRPQDHIAAHLYALICERLGLIDEAALSLERAAAVLEDVFERVESGEIEILYAIALCNLGRVLLSAGRYSDSLETLSNCWELISSSTESQTTVLKPQCKVIQGLAHYRLKQIDESLEAFQASLDEANQNQDLAMKEEVTILLTGALWGLGGDDARETAKNNLLECLSQERPSLKIISNLAAVALVSSDADLTEAAISELLARPIIERAQDPSGQAQLVLYLHAISEGREEDAYRVLQAAYETDNKTLDIQNQLAQALISAGNPKEALDVLAAPALKGTKAEARAEEQRLHGVAELMVGKEKGKRRLAKGVMLAPWVEDNWQSLAWGKKVAEDANLSEEEPITQATKASKLDESDIAGSI